MLPPCLVPPKPPSCVPPPAAPGFTHPPLSAEEAALRRALEHADGDHSSLIQVYEAFVQSKWLSLHPQTSRKYPIGDIPLCSGRGGPLPKGRSLCVLRT